MEYIKQHNAELKDIEGYIYNWVCENFGDAEADDPSWNISNLADYLEEQLKWNI